MRKLWGMAVVVLVVAGLAGAGVLAANHPIILAPIVANEDDDGTIISAAMGQHVSVVLEDPWPAQYGWQLWDIQGISLRYTGRSAPVPSEGVDRTACACFHFIAIGGGQTTISLVCTPPPEIKAPTRLYSVTIQVGS